MIVLIVYLFFSFIVKRSDFCQKDWYKAMRNRLDLVNFEENSEWKKKICVDKHSLKLPPNNALHLFVIGQMQFSYYWSWLVWSTWFMKWLYLSMNTRINKFFQRKSSNSWQAVFTFKKVLKRRFQLFITVFSFALCEFDWNINNALSF